MTMSTSRCSQCDLEGTTECKCVQPIKNLTRFQDACCLVTAGLLVLPFAFMWSIASVIGWILELFGVG